VSLFLLGGVDCSLVSPPYGLFLPRRRTFSVERLYFFLPSPDRGTRLFLRAERVKSAFSIFPILQPSASFFPGGEQVLPSGTLGICVGRTLPLSLMRGRAGVLNLSLLCSRILLLLLGGPSVFVLRFYDLSAAYVPRSYSFFLFVFVFFRLGRPSPHLMTETPSPSLQGSRFFIPLELRRPAFSFSTPPPRRPVPEGGRRTRLSPPASCVVYVESCLPSSTGLESFPPPPPLEGSFLAELKQLPPSLLWSSSRPLPEPPIRSSFLFSSSSFSFGRADAPPINKRPGLRHLPRRGSVVFSFQPVFFCNGVVSRCPPVAFLR